MSFLNWLLGIDSKEDFYKNHKADVSEILKIRFGNEKKNRRNENGVQKGNRGCEGLRPSN